MTLRSIRADSRRQRKRRQRLCRIVRMARTRRQHEKRSRLSHRSKRSPMQLIDSWLSDRVLLAALLFSAGAHAVLLAVLFVDPELLRMQQSDPTLDIVLVNAKSELAPSKPQALAQA